MKASELWVEFFFFEEEGMERIEGGGSLLFMRGAHNIPNTRGFLFVWDEMSF